MDIPLHADVDCSDGPGGQTTAVIVDPHTNKLTDIVVRESGLIGVEYIVPVELVAQSDASHVVLSCTRAKLAEQQTFIAYQYQPIPDEVPLAYLGPTVYQPYSLLDQEMNVPVGHESTPFGELALHRGATVRAADGRVGHVDDLSIDQRTHAISHIILREGHLWGAKDIAIRVAQIDRIDEDEVFLKLTKAEIEQLPAIHVYRKHT